jgi:hypothetical protein
MDIALRAAGIYRHELNTSRNRSLYFFEHNSSGAEPLLGFMSDVPLAREEEVVQAADFLVKKELYGGM